MTFPSELVALAINMATCQRVVEQICDPQIISQLVKRVHRTFDPLLMKFIHNITSICTMEHRLLFKKYLHEFAGMMTHNNSPDFIVEVLGTLGNLSFPPPPLSEEDPESTAAEEPSDSMEIGVGVVRYNEIITRHHIVDYFISLLSSELCEDDILLQLIIVIGTFCNDEKSASCLGDDHLLSLLCATLRGEFLTLPP